MNLPERIQSLIQQLTQQRAEMKAYQQLKVDTNDEHGVADSAMDIREIDAKLSILRELEKE